MRSHTKKAQQNQNGYLNPRTLNFNMWVCQNSFDYKHHLFCFIFICCFVRSFLQQTAALMPRANYLCVCVCEILATTKKSSALKILKLAENIFFEKKKKIHNFFCVFVFVFLLRFIFFYLFFIFLLQIIKSFKHFYNNQCLCMCVCVCVHTVYMRFFLILFVCCNLNGTSNTGI